MDSTIVQPLSAPSPSSVATASFPSLLERLARRSERAAAADALARTCGAEKMFAFVHDPEIDAHIPAPGFPASLPGGTLWPLFLNQCVERGLHKGEVEYPDAQSVSPVLAWRSDESLLIAFVGGTPRLDPGNLPNFDFLGALLKAEQAAFAAQGRAAAAEDAVRHATTLAASLDLMRSELEGALRAKHELLAKTKESEARKAAVLKTAVDAIFTLDHEGRILEYNAAAERIFGYQPQAFLGQELFALIFPPGDQETRRRELRELGAESGLATENRQELIAIGRSEVAFPVEYSINRVELDDRLPTFSAFVRDISERKLVESERERLLGIVGHDLRNPLQAISMGANVLLSRGSLTERDAQSVGRIQSSAQRMTRMITDLLDFERSRHGGIPLSRRRGQLASIVRQLIEEFEVSNPDRIIHYDAMSEGSGNWDPDRISQLISNLIGNAFQHSPANSAVNVTLANQDASVVLQISNANREAPLSDTELQFLFEPFRRGRSSTGLGLGLYIVRQIAKAHGGEVSALSNADGTVFRVLLPRE